MKYAIIDKGTNARILVGFKNLEERKEQEIRFGYEFPEGHFWPVDWKDARLLFGHAIEDMSLRCELCDGKDFPALLGYLPAILSYRDLFYKGYETGMTAEDIAVRWPE